MNLILILAFLFFVGATLGWCLEFLFRNLISHKGPRGKYFINPGFCKGPYLPIYGVGITVMCVISYIVTEHIPGASPVLVILCLAVCMNLIEFIGGLYLLKVLNMRLWDYRDRPGNFMGIVCPLFALIWTGIAAVYYLFIHKLALGWLDWLSRNLAFSFVVGLFWGVFIIDVTYSGRQAQAIKLFAKDRDVIVKYEELKAAVQKARVDADQKVKFFNQAVTEGERSVMESLEKHGEVLEDKAAAFKSKRNKGNKNEKSGSDK